ncbi:phosphodiesterase [Thermosipho melanesiensis]|uniref:Phosphoesterase n=2 Tax=Thermosipho melanesiensis TaxID=46541 RepID=A6LL32_THEM4|nr:metallophosphoesterase family protein [Thermosipho melanesiensis]ABR30633.1 phosphodiesterase, MJ0936 family [Thermosipho melanesiensis BI429]APT73772.1 phosphodiesterase [Thermosipho melanesiensis]OOC35712.1 phosphodiesterase [Thermosipho melanesiensis]OOC39011.1 phosphodiesterase [Thermosipho melanesiensis]OOC39159.1 phosphodiesterase [Thermosipho melanesiensis]
MKFLVISDLHIPTRNREIHPKIIELAKVCDGVFALGDFVDLETVLFLQSLNRSFFAVSGNMDEYDVKGYLPPQRVVKIGKFVIGLTHGSGSHVGIPERIVNWFSEDVNVVLFGHSHVPEDRFFHGKRFINPGTAMETYGIIDIGDTLKFEVFKEE